LQHFAHCIISSAQAVENKTKNFDAEIALKRIEALPEEKWVPQIVRRLHHEF
jgi:hypothetical protein